MWSHALQLKFKAEGTKLICCSRVLSSLAYKVKTQIAKSRSMTRMRHTWGRPGPSEVGSGPAEHVLRTVLRYRCRAPRVHPGHGSHRYIRVGPPGPAAGVLRVAGGRGRPSRQHTGGRGWDFPCQVVVKSESWSNEVVGGLEEVELVVGQRPRHLPGASACWRQGAS